MNNKIKLIIIFAIFTFLVIGAMDKKQKDVKNETKENKSVGPPPVSVPSIVPTKRN